MVKIDDQLKEIEKQQAAMEKQKKLLLEEKKKSEAQASKLEKLITQSGYKTAKALVEALVECFDVKITPATAAKETGRRKRTRITAEVRDSVKKAVAEGTSKNKISKQTGISYVVVSKICDGGYDHV